MIAKVILECGKHVPKALLCCVPGILGLVYLLEWSWTAATFSIGAVFLLVSVAGIINITILLRQEKARNAFDEVE